MATLIIPVTKDEQYLSQELSLDEVQYELRLRWNERMARWILSIYLLDGTPVQLGTPITTRSFLTRFNRSLNAPRGDFFAVDTTQNDADATETGLGLDVAFYYIEAETLAEMAG